MACKLGHDMVYLQWQKGSDGKPVRQTCLAAGSQDGRSHLSAGQMTMQATNALLASLTDGLLLGFVYGLSAMGLTLIFGVMGVVNLAHGALMALGMFGAFLLFAALHVSPYLALPLMALGGVLLGGVLYGIAIHPILNAPPLSTLLSTFAVNMIIIGAGTAIFSSTPRNIDINLGSAGLGSVQVSGTRLVAAAASVLVTARLYVFLYRTRAGKSVRAVANNRAAAELVGITSVQYLAMSFGIGVAAGGALG